MPKKSQGFPLTGKAKSTQFKATGGQRETGFKQKSEKQVTAAMQGTSMPSGKGPADKGPRKDAKKQFGSVPGKRVLLMAFPKKGTSTGPSKKQLAPFGGKPTKQTGFNIPGDKNFGEVGSRAKATAAMQGMEPPAMPKMRGKGPARADAKKQFKPSGKKVF